MGDAVVLIVEEVGEGKVAVAADWNGAAVEAEPFAAEPFAAAAAAEAGAELSVSDQNRTVLEIPGGDEVWLCRVSAKKCLERWYRRWIDYRTDGIFTLCISLVYTLSYKQFPIMFPNALKARFSPSVTASFLHWF